MASKSLNELEKSTCFRVRTLAKTLSIYHMILSIVIFTEYSLEVVKRKDCCPDVSKFYKIADAASSYLLLIVLFAISVLLFCGDLASRASLVIPFFALQFMDLILSALVLCSIYIELPTYIRTKAQGNVAALELTTASTTAINMFLSLLTLCSSYAEVPAYLNLQSMNYMNYFMEDNLASQNFVVDLITFTLLHFSVLMFKVSMIYSVWKVFKILRTRKQFTSVETPQPKTTDKDALPSYEDALKMPVIDCPPPYSTIKPIESF
ncbi:lysosomal-associated transmembrane protein 5 [Pelobates fuscus]|uniref:lysosomal-associated transmembrane protein 5 n=1 Tax=Pelobates fuscus TaxID=191477 RepID=UPI002FE4F980